jgi:hypothetical protein
VSAFTTCGGCKRQADHYTIANGRCICSECKDKHRQAGTCWRCGGQLFSLKEHERAECARCYAEVVA